MNEIKLKDVRGFTLVELLAVIVVLAIVMLIGLTAVVPLMNSARAQSFAIEANGAIESAQTYWMANMLGTDSTNALPTNDGAIKCVDIDTLINENYSDLEYGTYSGIVLVKNSGGSYLYVVALANGQLQTIGSGLNSDGVHNQDITSDDVDDYDSTAFAKYATCSDYLTASGGTTYAWPKLSS